jgi:spore germination protein GerM
VIGRTRSDTSRGRLAVGLAIGGLVLALLGACGITADGDPQPIASADLPPDLLDPSPGSSTTLPESADTTTVQVYLLDETADGVRLVAVDREVDQAGIPDDRLAALFGGATSAESEDGVTTGIPADTVLLDVTTDEEEDEVLIDLSEDIFSIEGEALAQALAQIVWTATEPDAGGFSRVRFSVEGEPTSVFDDDLAAQSAVTRVDYDAFAPLE